MEGVMMENGWLRVESIYYIVALRRTQHIEMNRLRSVDADRSGDESAFNAVLVGNDDEKIFVIHIEQIGALLE